MFKYLKLAIATIAALLLSGLTPVSANATGDCTVNITTSNTTVDGTDNGVFICINADNVTVNALGGDDAIAGGAGNDNLEGDIGVDDLCGEVGNDN